MEPGPRAELCIAGGREKNPGSAAGSKHANEVRAVVSARRPGGRHHMWAPSGL